MYADVRAPLLLGNRYRSALATTFDPVDFDAANMAKLAKAAGFKYLIYTTVHCDGFINWPSNLTDYTIVNTPWGKKGRGTYSELVKAFRAEGLKVGAYVCPSLWNNNSYWAPNALTSTGPVCSPNYNPESASSDGGAAKWKVFNTYLHGEFLSCFFFLLSSFFFLFPSTLMSRFLLFVTMARNPDEHHGCDLSPH